MSSTNAPRRRTWLWAIGWIFCFPIPVTILIWRKKCRLPLWTKIAITPVAWLFAIILISVGGNGDSSSSTINEPVVDNSSSVETADTTPETHLYDNAEVLNMMNGTGTEKIGTVTVIKANQADCTEDALYDWYVNYVKRHSDSNYHVIVYNDIENKGVYSNGLGFIQKDITLTPDNGTYMIGDDAGSTYYTVDENAKKLNIQTTMANASVVDSIKAKVDAVIPSEYKNSDLYGVNVAGEAGNMDCNLTLVNESFKEGDCQAVAEEIATKIKKLDLGIGSFCITFQKDDYTMTAISSIDNLKDQDATEISTKTF